MMKRHSKESGRVAVQGWSALLALGLILCGAFWLRAVHLSQASFNVDEYLHLFAAQSMNESGQPTLPSGAQYTRALPYTWLVAHTFRLLGVGELSARLPGVIMGILVLGLVYLIMRTWFTRTSALVAVGVLALAPWWMAADRNCRMYSMFHLTYLAAAWMAWRALEGPTRDRWLCGVSALALGGLAVWVHKLAMTLGVSMGVFILGQALLSRERRYILLSVLGLGCVAVAIGAGWLDLPNLWREIHSAPLWAEHSRNDWGFYLRKWWALYALFLLVYPLSLLWFWRRQRTVTWFLICAGVIPFALHSLVFDWKHVRYAAYLLPWLVIPTTAALVEGLRWLARKRAVWSIGLAVGIMLVAVRPWVWHLRTAVAGYSSPPWHAAYDWLQPRLSEEDAILTSMPLATLYYLQRPVSYVMNNLHVKDGNRPQPSGRDIHVWYIDQKYSGRPMVTTLDELKSVIEGHERGWILIDTWRLNGSHTMTKPMLAHIANSLERVMLDAASAGLNPIIAYHWDRSGARSSKSTLAKQEI